MHRILVILMAAATLAAIGWWGYQSQRGGSGLALELGSPVNKAGQGAAGTATGARPAPAAAAGSPPAAVSPGTAARPPAAGAPAGSPAAARSVGIEVALAESVSLTDEVLAVGTLRATESVVIKPEIAGRIVEIRFTDGAKVKRGDLLLRLDDSVLAAQVEQARAELGLAKTSFERTEDLAKRNFVSTSARDQAAATLKVQAARLELAQAQLAKTRIVAPFSGVLGLRNVSVGNFVKDGAEVVTLEDISSMKVDLRLPERYFGRLQRGQKISITVDAFPGREFQAALDALDAQVDANGRSLLARGMLANTDSALRSGMFAKARVVLQQKQNAVVVPEEAIQSAGASAFLYRIEGGKAFRTAVETGIRRDGKVEIVSGLKAGQQVVTAGQLRIRRDGTPVKVLTVEAKSAGAGGSPSTRER
jgi:membrane fusion protein (multidrug efflux system)